MPAYFFVRLQPHRPDFPANLTAEEGAAMKAHAAFLQAQLQAGTLVVAGPALLPTGVTGIGIFEVDDAAALAAILEQDPAQTVGRYEVAPMASAVVRPRS